MLFNNFIQTFLLSFIVLFNLCAETSEPFSMPSDAVVVMETNYGTMEFLLFPEIAPKACENFIRLSEEGYYNDVPFHRIIPNFMIQGGDFTHKNGRGGHSIWNKTFEDEFSDDLLFDAPGKLAMANAGPDSNGSQFFITTTSTPWLQNKHTLFGILVSGFETMEAIEALGSSSGAVGTWWQPVDPKPVILNVYLKF